MTSLTYEQHDNDGIEVIIEHPTGAAFFTQAGYSRMSQAPYATIRKRVQRLEGGDISGLKSAEILTGKGIQGVTLIPASLAFRWAMKDSPDLALKMGECGATVYAYQLAGIEVKAQIPEQPPAPPLPPPPPPPAN